MGYLSVKTVLLSMTGFSVIIPPQPPTLWFVSMIILFYYLFPIMSGQRISSVFMIAGCIILVVMAAQGGVWMLIDVFIIIFHASLSGLQPQDIYQTNSQIINLVY